MMRMVKKQPRLLNILVVLMLIGGLLLSACGELGLNLTLGGGEGGGDGGTVSDSTLLPVLLVVVLVVAVIALVGRR